ATGAATPAVLFRLPPVYVWLHDRLGGSALAFGAARFGLAAGVLLAPCTLMGATLPLIARAPIARGDRVGRAAGALYAANTLGAGLGGVGGGFGRVRRLGLAATSAVAAAVNLAVGLVALALGTTAARTGARAVAAPATAHARLVMLAFGLSGFTALGYEVLWTRALVHYTHNSTYAYSAMLAVFLLGLALGSAALGAVTDRLRRPLLALGAVEILTGASVVGGLALYARYDRLVPAAAAAMGGLGSWPRVVALVFGEAGAALPLVPPSLFADGFARRFGPLLFYREEATDTVMVTRDARGERMLRFGDGRGTAGTMTVRDDRMYAHIPLLLHPAARRVLNICFGVGNSLAAVASVFPQVSVWRGPLRYSWVINGSVGPHGPDLALLARRFAEPRVRGDLAEIGVPDPFAFLAHFVLAGGEVAAFAGAGPVASDDSTRLDFTVPRSLDSFFGLANASSGGWLVDLMEPGARHDVGLAVFWRKLAR